MATTRHDFFLWKIDIHGFIHVCQPFKCGCWCELVRLVRASAPSETDYEIARGNSDRNCNIFSVTTEAKIFFNEMQKKKKKKL